MHKNIKTVAGCFTRITCDFTTTDGSTPEIEAYISIEQEKHSAHKESANVLIMPAVDYGQHLYEVRAAGKPVIFGHLLVRPSAFPHEQGVVDYSLSADLTATDALNIELTLTPGPRGPAGLSAYELAVEAGYKGTQDEWVAELQGAQAAAAEAKEWAEKAASHQWTAEEFKYDAATAAAASERAAAGAQESAAGAVASAEAAASNRALAEDRAESAKYSATKAAKSATAAAASEEKAAKSATAAAASEEEAAKSAALLGDAALCGGNNVFSAGNVFNGSLAINGPLEVTGDFSWGGFGADWREDVWLACCGTNPRSKGCTTFSEWMVLNPDWASRQRLVIYMPATGAHVFDNIKPVGEGVCEECVYVGKCISYEAANACYLAFGSRKWTIFMTGSVIRGFAGLSTVEALSLFMPWGQFSGSAAFAGLGRKAQRCVLRVFAPVARDVYVLFRECYWTELVLEVPALEKSFTMGGGEYAGGV